jgi:phosphoribosylformylglycinamidine synthase subunit PurQ / glutaminase
VRFGIVVFPGSNCDRDCYHVTKNVFGQDTSYLWHKDHDLQHCDCIVLPGGFSYGDYLRTGAIARFSPIMSEVERFAQSGGLVIGICNGFQTLLETGLLPGAMLRNDSLEFRCQWADLRVETTDTPFTKAMKRGQVLRVPIAHGEGNYFADEALLRELESNQQVVLRYASPTGEVTAEANPNGSAGNIAGICSRARNVFGLMPHPERCSESVLGGTDGPLFFESLLQGAM